MKSIIFKLNQQYSRVIFLPEVRTFDKVYRIDEAVVMFKSDPMCIHV